MEERSEEIASLEKRLSEVLGQLNVTESAQGGNWRRLRQINSLRRTAHGIKTRIDNLRNPGGRPNNSLPIPGDLLGSSNAVDLANSLGRRIAVGGDTVGTVVRLNHPSGRWPEGSIVVDYGENGRQTFDFRGLHSKLRDGSFRWADRKQLAPANPVADRLIFKNRGSRLKDISEHPGVFEHVLAAVKSVSPSGSVSNFSSKKYPDAEGGQHTVYFISGDRSFTGSGRSVEEATRQAVGKLSEADRQRRDFESNRTDDDRRREADELAAKNREMMADLQRRFPGMFGGPKRNSRPFDRSQRYARNIDPHPLFARDGVNPHLHHLLTNIAASEGRFPESGEIATVILSLGRTDLFPQLGQALAAEGHPDAKTLNWKRVGRAVELDNRILGTLIPDGLRGGGRQMGHAEFGAMAPWRQMRILGEHDLTGRRRGYAGYYDTEAMMPGFQMANRIMGKMVDAGYRPREVVAAFGRLNRRASILDADRNSEMNHQDNEDRLRAGRNAIWQVGSPVALPTEIRTSRPRDPRRMSRKSFATGPVLYAPPPWGTRSHRQGITHADLHRWLGKKQSRNVDRNKVVHRDGDDIIVTLHRTPVVRLHPDGTFTLRTGGWNTPTTRRTIGNVIGFPVRSVKGKPMIGGKELTEGMRWPELPQAPEVDYRPQEVIPEDYYALSRLPRGLKLRLSRAAQAHRSIVVRYKKCPRCGSASRKTQSIMYRWRCKNCGLSHGRTAYAEEGGMPWVHGGKKGYSRGQPFTWTTLDGRCHFGYIIDIDNGTLIVQLPNGSTTAVRNDMPRKYAKKPRRLFRGVSPESGTKSYRQGKGLYTTTTPGYATQYGEVHELPPEAAPKNPLKLRSEEHWDGWLVDQYVNHLGMKNIREFAAKYPDPGEYVRSLGYDGVQIGDGGRDTTYVNYFPPKDLPMKKYEGGKKGYARPVRYSHEAFGRKIADNRFGDQYEDVTPSLVYADWLDENEMPVYANFIRNHVEKSGAPEATLSHNRLGDYARQLPALQPFRPTVTVLQYGNHPESNHHIHVTTHVPEGYDHRSFSYSQIVHGRQAAIDLIRGLTGEGLDFQPHPDQRFWPRGFPERLRRPGRPRRYAASPAARILESHLRDQGMHHAAAIVRGHYQQYANTNDAPSVTPISHMGPILSDHVTKDSPGDDGQPVPTVTVNPGTAPDNLLFSLYTYHGSPHDLDLKTVNHHTLIPRSVAPSFLKNLAREGVHNADREYRLFTRKYGSFPHHDPELPPEFPPVDNEVDWRPNEVIPEDYYSGGGEAHQYEAYRAPAGGSIVRGLFYKGGSLIPDLKKFAPTRPARRAPR